MLHTEIKTVAKNNKHDDDGGDGDNGGDERTKLYK